MKPSFREYHRLGNIIVVFGRKDVIKNMKGYVCSPSTDSVGDFESVVHCSLERADR